MENCADKITREVRTAVLAGVQWMHDGVTTGPAVERRCNRTGGSWWQDKIFSSSSSSCSCLDTQDTHRCCIPDGRLDYTSLQFSCSVRGHLLYSRVSVADNLEAILLPTCFQRGLLTFSTMEPGGLVVTSKSLLPVFVPQSTAYLLPH